jgi:D-glycero-alpha-D-manno-heptose-7-phosphate kinase
MIICRSPLRVSLGGGGTDLPSYYRDHGGFVIAAAIDKYVFITLHETFQKQIIVKYSKLEKVDSVDEIQHPIVREAVKLVPPTPQHLEITSMSDIPAGTGLGSSGSFTTALLRSLHAWKRDCIDPRELAEQACHIEMDLLGEPVGKQDQYIASYGGLTCFTIDHDGSVEVRPLEVNEETRNDLEDNLIFFYTGVTRSASAILKDQDDRTKQCDCRMVENLHRVKELGLASKQAMEKGDLREFANIMHIHWENKRKRSNGMTSAIIDEYYELARANGALGGKVIGAGGGGFLMLYTEDKTRLRRAMSKTGLREVRFRFDFQGSTVMAIS